VGGGGGAVDLGGGGSSGQGCAARRIWGRGVVRVSEGVVGAELGFSWGAGWIGSVLIFVHFSPLDRRRCTVKMGLHGTICGKEGTEF
jgi:hypothetical protein